MKFNWAAQIASYTGALNFPAVIDNPVSVTLPAVSIPLFIKEHPTPIRQPKPAEINTLSGYTRSGFDTSVSAVFWGTPEPLTLSLNGWLVTPTKKNNDPIAGIQRDLWYPTTNGSSTGTALQLINVSYGELILAYIEGRLSRNTQGRFVPTQPSSYVDPNGNQYNNPIITDFEVSFTPTLKKQQFNISMYLETWNA